MTIDFTYDLTSSSTASASEVMQNFDDVAAAVDLIGASQFDPEDPLDNNAIATRFTVQPVVLYIVPYSGAVSTNLTFATATEIKIPSTYTRIGPMCKVMVGTGQKVSLVGIRYYCGGMTAGGSGGNPKMKFLKSADGGSTGAVTIGSEQTTITELSWYSLELSNPVDNPIMQLQDGDTLSTWLGAANAGDDATIRDLTVIFYLKVENVG